MYNLYNSSKLNIYLIHKLPKADLIHMFWGT